MDLKKEIKLSDLVRKRAAGTPKRTGEAQARAQAEPPRWSRPSSSG